MRRVRSCSRAGRNRSCQVSDVASQPNGPRKEPRHPPASIVAAPRPTFTGARLSIDSPPAVRILVGLTRGRGAQARRTGRPGISSHIDGDAALYRIPNAHELVQASGPTNVIQRCTGARTRPGSLRSLTTTFRQERRGSRTSPALHLALSLPRVAECGDTSLRRPP